MKVITMPVLTKEQQITGTGSIERDPPREQEKPFYHGTQTVLSKRGSPEIMGEDLVRMSPS